MSYVPLTRPIVVRESITASETPTSGDISLGEIAINSADGNMFIKTTANDIVQVNGGGGGGGSAPATEVVFGTGTGTTSSSYLKYDDTNGEFILNAGGRDNLVNKLVSGIPGKVKIYAAESGDADTAGGNIEIVSGPGSTTGNSPGGTIYIKGGAGGGTNQGGTIVISSGNPESDPTGTQYNAAIEMSGGASADGIDVSGGAITIRAGENAGAGAGIGGYIDIVIPSNSLRINGSDGSAGQVLTSRGPGLPPQWDNPSGPSIFPTGVWNGTVSTYVLGTDGKFPGLSNLLNSDAVTYNNVTGAFTLVGGGTYSIMVRAVITSTDAADTGTTAVELFLSDNSWALPLNQVYNVTSGATQTTCILSGIIYGSNGLSATPALYVEPGTWGTATTLSLAVDIFIVKLNGQQGV